MNATIITINNLADYNPDCYYALEADYDAPWGWGVATKLINALATVDDLLTLVATDNKVIDARLRLNTKAFKDCPARWD